VIPTPWSAVSEEKACVVCAPFYSRAMFSQSLQGGEIRILKPCQQVLETSAILITEEYVEVRFLVGLPGYGRKVRAAPFLFATSRSTAERESVSSFLGQ